MLSHQECPTCGGAVNTENAAVEELWQHRVEYLYCEFCETGIETLFVREGDRMREKFRNVVDNKNPRRLGMFLQRLRDASVVSELKFTKAVKVLREVTSAVA